MRRTLVFGFLATIGLSATAMNRCGAAEATNAAPRTAVISAYEPEWVELRAALRQSHQYIIDRTTFLTGSIEGRLVVLFLSGVSIVNAALTTQLALDHFNVSQVVFSGVAGGVDPALSIGDVVVPHQWSEYLESAFARETNAGYVLPPFESKTLNNFGMIFPQPVAIANPGGQPKRIEWFQADPHLLVVARIVAGSVHLASCTPDKRCLARQPKVVVGGNGVSGQAFVDNAAFRRYIYSTFSAKVVDMESAAVAHVAYINAKPFIAFRSLSDLAGADPDHNEESTFEQLASGNSATLVEAFLKALQ